MESSPFTNCSRCRMLMSPIPRRFTASCESKPLPASITDKKISPVWPRSSTLKSLTPLCLTAFCNASCKTRNKQSAISFGRLRGTSEWLKEICTLYSSDNSLQKLWAATAIPKYSSLEEWSRCDRA